MGPHDVLDVPAGASKQQLTDAFRRFALVHHPDRGGDPAHFRAGVDAYRRLTGSRPPPYPRADLVFHRRARPGPASLLRLAGRRLAGVRSRP